MRGTFTHANPDFLEDIKTMLDLGFTELSMEPVVAAEGDPAALTEADKPIVLKQYEELARLMLKRDKEGRPFTFYHYMIDLKGGPCIYKRISAAAREPNIWRSNPMGDLYPCHQFVGDENSSSAIFGRALTTPPFKTNLPHVTYTQERIAATVGQSSIARAAVPQTHITQPALSEVSISMDATSSAKEWNVR